jgi:hypothetical protein
MSLYDYDASTPFDVQKVKSEQKEGATVHDLSYGGRTDGSLRSSRAATS